MTSKRRVQCHCLLCRPVPGKRAHPECGYDLDAVPEVHCLMCKQPIGSEPYEHDAGLARFGTMLFMHRRCADQARKRGAA